MEAFFISIGVVSLAELGDKTQLLAFLLAVRFRQRAPVLAGILVASLLSHGAAAALGGLLATWLTPELLRWVVGMSFLVIAVWTLLPDGERLDADPRLRIGVFGTTVATFFLAELGDKTQVASVLLAARFETILPIVLGATVAMMLVNAPAVLLGRHMADRLPVRAIRIAAATVFAVLGLLTLTGFAARLGL